MVDAQDREEPVFISGVYPHLTTYADNGNLHNRLNECGIDAQGKVRAVSPEVMPGRITAFTRHLKDPENWVYCPKTRPKSTKTPEIKLHCDNMTSAFRPSVLPEDRPLNRLLATLKATIK